MPDLEWNSTTWDETYPWDQQGEEWSAVWGGSRAQWFGSIYPRIARHLPAATILEIAPGFGRWTKFLIEMATTSFVGVDLARKCVDACTRRFAHVPGASFFANDGCSLDMLPDGSVDFVFSFDSLVHADCPTVDAYISEIVRKLSPNGVAFLHHSNAAKEHDPQNPDAHWRARDVSADTTAAAIASSGGRILIQEELNWGGAYATDCLSTFSRSDSAFTSPPIHLRNLAFLDELRIVRDYHAPYLNLSRGT